MFYQARLKLTGLYVLIVAIIVCGFSFYLYQNIDSNLKDADLDSFADVEHHDAFIEHTLSETANNIIIADIFIIVVAAGLSYALAGRTLEPIQRSVEAQKAFAANASHELRTPLAVMKNDIEVLRRNRHRSHDDVETVLKSNTEEIAHMSSIVEDLLLLARSDNQKIPEFVSLDVSTLLESVLEKMRPLAQEKDISLKYTDSNSLAIKGFPLHLKRAIINIVQNSIEHSTKGGTISISTSATPAGIQIQFVDAGTGIDAKDLPHILTRFYKGESSTGTGLGLSIVKEIVEQHRGSLSIESEKNKGTTVTLRFPQG